VEARSAKPVLLAPALTPHGRLHLEETAGGDAVEPRLAARLLVAFERGAGEGLLQLGAAEVGTVLPPVLAYWRDFASRFVTALCGQPDIEPQPGSPSTAAGSASASRAPVVPPLPDADLDALIAARPPMAGAEYLTREVLVDLWGALQSAFASRMAQAGASVQETLRAFHPAWNTVGRVHFHLAEQRKDPDAPFAFLATYTERLSAHGKAQHLPLGQALRQYAGAANKPRLLSLLVPVQRAAADCPWLKAMVDEGEIFHPLRWTPREAFALLQDVHLLERAGVIVRVPAGWRGGRPPRPRVTATVGSKPPGGLGLETLLDFDMGVTLDGEPLTTAEIRALLEGADGLVLLRGRWAEVDREKLAGMLEQFRKIDRAAAAGGLTFAEAMRLLAGADARTGDAGDQAREWSGVRAGPWLARALDALRGPEGIAPVEPGSDLHGTLRPYQQVGLRWLHFLSSLGLGACLADDMGLGKTVQVLALLLVLKKQREAASQSRTHRPSLLVAPASLLANWASEISRFAPGLATVVAHPSVMPADDLNALDEPRLAEIDLVITSYGFARRLPSLAAVRWDLLVVDEAQAIKNPSAKQTRAVKAIQARARVALTGTPIENRLGDLWSIFDLINPGLLGSAAQFTALTKRLGERPHNAYGPLRDLVRPYILRRMKTDRSVIADLPAKTEMNAFCLLSRRQAALYEQTVRDLRDRLARVDGMERRGLVLSSLMRLKQICNHPSQWLNDGAWTPADSGKWARLAEIAEVMAARQEKVLVFTQFREITSPLADYLAVVFGRPGLVLHGGTPVKARKDLVARFQDAENVPFFVLSLKAGGTGLNLTAASHVVHFDRWWNPAVEDQATDRAFRIGQVRNVLVHKFVCRGTVEERIDDLIASKRSLASDVLEGGAELLLTEMKDEELLRLVALDVNAAMKE
jgi:non-specific serine/threonine protein kinase